MRLRVAAALFAVMLLSTAGLAGPGEDFFVRWYALLAKADAQGLSALLAQDARIRLDDLGIVQTKTEFLDSMDEWATAVAGASIRHRVERFSGDVTTVVVCYDFPSNDLLVRETFTTRDGLIVDSVQTKIADTCTVY